MARGRRRHRPRFARERDHAVARWICNVHVELSGACPHCVPRFCLMYRCTWLCLGVWSVSSNRRNSLSEGTGGVESLSPLRCVECFVWKTVPVPVRYRSVGVTRDQLSQFGFDVCRCHPTPRWQQTTMCGSHGSRQLTLRRALRFMPSQPILSSDGVWTGQNLLAQLRQHPRSSGGSNSAGRSSARRLPTIS